MILVIAHGVVTETVLGLVERRLGKAQDFGVLFVKKGKFKKFSYSPILEIQQITPADCPLRESEGGNRLNMLCLIFLKNRSFFYHSSYDIHDCARIVKSWIES